MNTYHSKKSVFFLFLLTLSITTFGQCYEMVWSDEFNGTALDTSIWNIEVNGNVSNNELQYYTDRPQNIYVDNGVLTLKAIKESYLGKQYTSGRINTLDKYTFQYGKIEARMKLPYGQGIWPALWMLGESLNTAGWPNCGEIDMMEMIGGTTGDKTVYSTLHWGPVTNGNHPNYGLSYALPSGKFSDDYHIFTTEWNSQTVKTYVDGDLYYTIDISPVGLDAFHHPFFIILNLAVGGDWPGSPDGTTVFPQQYEIDYIRVYQTEGSVKIDGPNEVYAHDSAITFSVPEVEGWQYQWTLPSGVNALSDLNSNSILVNWGCIGGEIQCAFEGVDCLIDTAEIIIAIKEPIIIGNQFFQPNEENLNYSIPPLHSTTYEWQVPAWATITEGQGTPNITVNWGTIKDTVKLVTNNACGSVNYTKVIFPIGQYAYPNPEIPHSIPGTIISTQYDFGGEGVAYHDNETDNQGTGPREEEGVDTENGDGGSNVGWVNSGEWLEYSVKVQHDGEYKIDLRVAALSAAPGPKIAFNDENRTENIPVTATGNWGVFKTISVGPVDIYTTDTLMKINLGAGGYNLGNIVISNYDGTGIETTVPNDVEIYPNPATDELYIISDQHFSRYTIVDLSGKTIQSETDQYNEVWNISLMDIKSGFYFLILTTPNGDFHYNRFMKL